MKNILTDIIKNKKEEISKSKNTTPIDILEKRISKMPPCRAFKKQLQKNNRVSLIAEIKHKSPSRGTICSNFDPAKIARTYTLAGASAISVLIDNKFFGGAPEYIKIVQGNTNLPILCKEFILDSYQVYQARALGADAILLISRILSPCQIQNFIKLAEKLGMETIVETHNAKEINLAINSGAKIIGINNRNLENFQTNMETTFSLRKQINEGITVVSESGIYCREDMNKLFKHEIHAALVGETLMRSTDPYTTARELAGNNGAREVG
ncbi:MAG: indole-3-glycerol phosphate synthase TrpC [Clostridiales bacterium]|nr:indole-3-glycerol phosphate synthase TrpC [Clostridiales bacterium]MCF8023432.1 indole-3-glycerol phosphate synthase TrpC [Clostridiales bacterium]